MVEKYLQDVFLKYKTGQAGERSYYPVLENLLIEATREIGNYSILVEAKNSTVGIPDFKIQDDKGLLIGYIEAKDVGRDLDHLSAGENEQIRKYVKEYEKVLVTNFTQFRLYEDHALVAEVTLTEPVTLQLGQPVLQNEAIFRAILERFLYTPVSQIYTAKRLSEVLAKKTHTLRDLVLEEINLEDKVTTKTEELLETFRKTLDPDMTPEKFSDMYAQTITFGLFVARINSGDNEFTRFSAYKYIPNTISLLREVFKILSWQELPSHIEWSVDEIVETLAYTKIDKITDEFFSRGKWRDPIIHFYETFLASYDPKEREKRGVYYTPQPVVSYITRSVHHLLQEKFGIQDGFADPSVTLLDPAGGTLTFPAEAIAVAKEAFISHHGDGGWKNLVRNHILKNFYAFELLMAPYAIGHLKIALLLKELGYEMDNNDRFRLYLTNTLDFKEVETLPLLMLAKEITEESKDAFEVKTKEKTLVIMGNPPYSVSSSNKIEENTEFFEVYNSYKEIVRKEEKNIQPLSDDYIKFIAFAHWKIKQARQGIIGMITNNSYLDGLIHRDMRRKLLEDFEEIYILNLHGSAKKQEKTPTGEPDENVFDIQQGVSIVLFVKKKSLKKSVNYVDLWGKREEKYSFLEGHNISNTLWKRIKFNDSGYLFSLPNDPKKHKQYSSFLSWNSIFSDNSSCVTTGNDKVLTGTTKSQLLTNIRALFEFNESRIDQEKIKQYAYKPFISKYIYYDRKLLQRPRYEVMSNMLNTNKAILLMRKIVGDEWSHALVTDTIADKNFYGFQSYIFPLYKYINSDQQEVLNLSSKTPNLARDLGHAPEEIFNYIYAILYSNIYREKYQEFLKTDFPRIPFTKDVELFKKLAELGEELVQLHLLKHPVLNTPISKYNGQGEGQIDEIKYYETTTEMSWPSRPSSTIKDGIIKTSDTQFFDNVTPEVWNYYIGGYQVLSKWLKDRKGRKLSLEDAMHYRKVITALSETIKIQEKIDTLYPKIEKSLTKD